MRIFFTEFRKFFGLINKKYKAYYFAYAITTVFTYMIYMAMPIFYGLIIDSLTSGLYYKDYFIYYIIIFIGTFILFRLWSLLNVFIQGKSRSILYNKLFAASLKAKNADNTIFSQDIDKASQLFLDFVYCLPSEVIIFVLVFVLLVIYSRLFLIVYLVSFSIFLVLTLIRNKRVTPHYLDSQNEFYNLQSQTEELIKGSFEITIGQSQDWATKIFNEHISLYNKSILRYKKKSTVVEFISHINNQLSYCFATLISIYLFLNDYCTFGMCVILIQYAQDIYDKLSSIYENLHYLLDFTVHLKRINTRNTEKLQIINNLVLKDICDDVYLVADNIGHSYCDKTIFNRVSFVLNKGDILAIKGTSGSGKSTILSIITNQIVLQNGKIEIYGDKKIGILEQFPYLFNRSIRENFLIVKPNATDSEIEKALVDVSLHDFKGCLSKSIGEMGQNISGGQRTRLGLARLILFNPDIVLLDEPLIGVDSNTRKIIIRFLKDFLKEKACIITSHEKNIVEIANKEVRL